MIIGWEWCEHCGVQVSVDGLSAHGAFTCPACGHVQCADLETYMSEEEEIA